VKPKENIVLDEWIFWLRLQMQDMLEEANGFFLEWGWTWMSWWQLFGTTMFMIFGPCIMCFQTYRTFGWVSNLKN